MRKWITLVIIALLAAALAVFFFYYREYRPVAVVNGSPISEREFKSYYDVSKKVLENQQKPEKLDWNKMQDGKKYSDVLKEQTINRMVEEKILLLKADEMKITTTKEDVQKMRKLLPKEYTDEMVRREAVINKLFETITKNAAVSDSEARKFYDANKDMFMYADIYRIDVKTKEDADKIYSLLKTGTDFASLAKQHSIDISSKDNGGFIGNMPIKQYSAVISYDFGRLKSGDITPPIKTVSGYEIVRIENLKVKPFDEVKEEIKTNILNDKKSEIISDFIKKLKSNAKIDIKWNNVYGVDAG